MIVISLQMLGAVPTICVRSSEMTTADVDMNFITGISPQGSGQAQRMLILVDIAGMMSSAEMGLPHRAR